MAVYQSGQPFPDCEFESQSGHKLSSMGFFLGIVVEGFPSVLRFPPLLHWFMFSVLTKQNINVILALPSFKAELSFASPDCTVLCVIIILLYCHMGMHVGDSLQHSEQIIKKSRMKLSNMMIIIFIITVYGYFHELFDFPFSMDDVEAVINSDELCALLTTE